MTKSLAKCPDCAGQATCIGPIPGSDVFAGEAHSLLLPGGALYRCTRCSLGFRWPSLNKSQLDTLYRQGNEWNWTKPTQARRDWLVARESLKPLLHAQSKILDVGCWDGGFLSSLIGSHFCYGIEIHPSASERAKQKGIEILGADWAAVTGTFDCVTAFDVIEHVERPGLFLKHCVGAVRPGGWVLVSTGNLDAFTFRLMGSRYWYTAIAEHISFVSPTWFQRLANSLGYKIIMETSFVHGDSSIRTRIGQSASNLLYRINPKAFRFLRKIGLGGIDLNARPELADHPPGWGGARDHFMVLIQKNE